MQKRRQRLLRQHSRDSLDELQASLMTKSSTKFEASSRMERASRLNTYAEIPRARFPSTDLLTPPFNPFLPSIRPWRNVRVLPLLLLPFFLSHRRLFRDSPEKLRRGH